MINSNPFANRAFHQPKHTNQGLLGFLNVGRFFYNTETTTIEGALIEEHKSLSKNIGVATDLSIPELEILAKEAPLTLTKKFLENFV